jgi:hypothetical protein
MTHGDNTIQQRQLARMNRIQNRIAEIKQILERISCDTDLGDYRKAINSSLLIVKILVNLLVEEIEQ